MKLDDKAMKGDIASEIAIENLLTIVNVEDDKEKDREQEINWHRETKGPSKIPVLNITKHYVCLKPVTKVKSRE